MIDQPCEICGKPNAPFGYGPPLHPQTMWRCGAHRPEGSAPRSQPDAIQMIVNAWTVANWPTDSDTNVCRHCRRKSDDLIPLGYGKRPRVWVHIECSDLYRAELRRQALAAIDAPEKWASGLSEPLYAPVLIEKQPNSVRRQARD
jgi:hypothetical protein